MKQIVILAIALIVSATAFAQKNESVEKLQQLPANSVQTTAPKDTATFHIVLDKVKLQLLFQSLEGFGQLVKRSPDVSALQADESLKGVVALSNDIYTQLKPQLPPAPSNPTATNGLDPKHK